MKWKAINPTVAIGAGRVIDAYRSDGPGVFGQGDRRRQLADGRSGAALVAARVLNVLLHGCHAGVPPLAVAIHIPLGPRCHHGICTHVSVHT